MTIKVKALADVQKKWLEVTPQRSAYYQAGAVGAGDEWEKNTSAAAPAFKQAMTAANLEALYKGGIKRARAAKYNRKVEAVGVARFSQGVQAAGEDYGSGVSPFLDEIAKIDLGVRAPRGSISNYERVQKIGTALNKKRLALRAAGS